MNLRTAIENLELHNYKRIDRKIAKHKFRELAHLHHPDKCLFEHQKLNKTKIFIKIKESYDYICRAIEYQEFIENPYYLSNSQPCESKPNQRIKAEESLWKSYLFLLVLPFGIIVLFYMLGFILIISSLKELKSRINKSKFDTIIFIWGALLQQILPYTIGLIYLPYWAIKSAFIHFNVWTQIGIVQNLFVVIFLLRSYYERKKLNIKYNVNEIYQSIEA